jgi:hypothetical protein
MTCEILEKIEKHPDGDKPGVMISAGGASLLNDFAAVVAFALDITCTPDSDLTRRLLATERPSLGVQTVPNNFMTRTFDKQVISKEGDADVLAQFVTHLVGLERKRFEAAMRSKRCALFDVQRFATGFGKLVSGIGQAALDREGKESAAYLLHLDLAHACRFPKSLTYGG